jgi:hypothetical protein
MLAVGLLGTPKFDTFYRVFKKAFENKRSSKPFGLIPFGACTQITQNHRQLLAFLVVSLKEQLLVDWLSRNKKLAELLG